MKKGQRKSSSQLNQTEKICHKSIKKPKPLSYQNISKNKVSEICKCDYILNVVILKPLLSLM